MREDRLRKLIEVMQLVAARPDVQRKFHMQYWYSRWFEHADRLDDDEPYYVFGDLGLEPVDEIAGTDQPWTDCGTSACALGWFACSPQALGDGWCAHDNSYSYKFMSFCGGARAYFEINEAAFNYLFLPSSYRFVVGEKITPDDVIKHVETLIAGLAPGECYEGNALTR